MTWNTGPSQPHADPPILQPLLAVFAATIAAQLVSLAFGRANPELEFASIVLPSVVYLSAITLPLAWLGLLLGRRIGLDTPRLSGLLYRSPGALRAIGRDAVLGILLGLALGAVLILVRSLTAPGLPPELPPFGHRGVVGGLAVSLGAAVAEEVWFRLGLMTILFWAAVRLLGQSEVKTVVAWPIIVLTAIGFGIAHLPQLMSYGAGSAIAIAGTILGNCLVGTLYGWCYWRRSLFAAMVAHFSVDVVIHVLPAVFA